MFMAGKLCQDSEPLTDAERPEKVSLACVDVAVGEGSGLPDGDDAAAADGEGFLQHSETRRKKGEGGVPWWASVDQRPLIHGCNVICCEYLQGTPRQGTKVLVRQQRTTRRVVSKVPCRLLGAAFGPSVGLGSDMDIRQDWKHE